MIWTGISDPISVRSLPIKGTHKIHPGKGFIGSFDLDPDHYKTILLNFMNPFKLLRDIYKLNLVKLDCHPWDKVPLPLFFLSHSNLSGFHVLYSKGTSIFFEVICILGWVNLTMFSLTLKTSKNNQFFGKKLKLVHCSFVTLDNFLHCVYCTVSIYSSLFNLNCTLGLRNIICIPEQWSVTCLQRIFMFFSVTQLIRCWQFLTLITPLEQMIMTSNSFALLLFNKQRVELASNSQTKQKQIQKSIWEKVSVHVIGHVMGYILWLRLLDCVRFKEDFVNRGSLNRGSVPYITFYCNFGRAEENCS